MGAYADAMFTAAITAGGQSRRFGSDKAQAIWEGRTLLEHVAASFPPTRSRLLLAPPGKYTLPHWQEVSDLRPGAGPLAGLETALAQAPAGWVAFAGVDNPKLTPAYWERLFAARRVGALSVQALHPERGPQPLGALYHTDLLPHVAGLLGAGERRLRHAVAGQQVALVGGLGAEWFWNVNTRGDLERLT